MPNFDFDGLASTLLGQAEMLVSEWLPGGKREGHEYRCATGTGGKGRSFSVNLQTGVWAEFNGLGAKGGDLISLYAAVHEVTQGDAFKALGGYISSPIPMPLSAPIEETCPPPADTPAPDCISGKYGKPSGVWCYRSEAGAVMFYVARYDRKEGKEIVPWSWLASKQAWIPRSFPKPRPLYGEWKLPEMPGKPVLLVEGEKKADAAQVIVGDRYAVMGWAGGASAVKTANWSCLAGRKILLWPDADEPGAKAMQAVYESTRPVTDAEIAVIEVSGQPAKWDAADALSEGWDWPRLAAWAVPRKRVLPPAPIPVAAPAAAPFEKSAIARWSQLGLSVNAGGQPALNMDNVLRFLEGEKAPIWRDSFSGKIRTGWDFSVHRPSDKPHDWHDSDVLSLLLYLQRHLGLTKIAEDAVLKAVESYAYSHTKSEPAEWLLGLVWDKKPRLNNMLTDVFHVKPSQYHEHVISNCFKAMVARVLNPGCKADEMMVLIGPQGCRKSTALEIIGGQWYASVQQKVDTDDFTRAVHGKMLVEIAELTAFKKADSEAIKRMLSTPSDRYTEKYARYAQDVPRTCIFVGTTNQDEFLNDPTGARRFWPVILPDDKPIDTERLKEQREQLFAEAVYRWKYLAEPWHVVDNVEALKATDAHRVGDPWEEQVLLWVMGITDPTIYDICTSALKLEPKYIDRATTARIGNILRAHGRKSKVTTRNGISVRIWPEPEIRTMK